MSSKILGDVAIGEVRRWANTCEDEGGRLYALPLADAYDELRAELETLQHAHEDVLDALSLRTADIDRLRARLDAAERLIEVVRAREIGTSGGVGAAFQAYDQAGA